MIERYTREEMGNIWTEENKFKAWLEVEVLACEAWSELGFIPKEDVKKNCVRMLPLILTAYMKLNRKHGMMWWHLPVLYQKL